LGVGYEKAGTTKEKLIRLWWGSEKPDFAGKPMSPEMAKRLCEDAKDGAKW